MKIVNTKEMKEIEATAKSEYGLDENLIIENIGLRGAGFIQRVIMPQMQDAQLVFFLGKGNNAADGVAMARHLSCYGHTPRVFLLFPEDQLKGELQKQLKMAQAYGVRVNIIEQVDDLEGFFDHTGDILAVDAIFGTGVQLPLSNFIYDVISFINQRAQFVVSVDIPSGVEGDTGFAQGNAVMADITLAVGLSKVGHYVADGATHSGEVKVLDMGVPYKLLREGDKFLLDEDALENSVHKRNKFADKKVFGHTLILGGSHGLTGALVMASQAALKVGAGLITAATWEGQYQEFISRLIPEIMTGYLPLDVSKWPRLIQDLNKYSAIVIGPGLARSSRSRRLVIEILNNFDGPVVLDADAINVLSLEEDGKVFSMRNAPTVLTPHMGEFSRFSGVDYDELQRRPLVHLKNVIETINCAVVLKGPCTFLGLPDGSTYVNFSPNDGMAKGGVGDVLAGLMGGLLGQDQELKTKTQSLEVRYQRMSNNIKLAVYIHTLAGKLAVEQFGVRAMTATSLLEVLPDVFEKMREKLDSFSIDGIDYV